MRSTSKLRLPSDWLRTAIRPSGRQDVGSPEPSATTAIAAAVASAPLSSSLATSVATAIASAVATTDSATTLPAALEPSAAWVPGEAVLETPIYANPVEEEYY